MFTPIEIQTKIFKILEAQSPLTTRPTLKASLSQDLGFDSLDHVEIIMEIEDALDCSIPDKEAELLDIVEDLIYYAAEDKLPKHLQFRALSKSKSKSKLPKSQPPHKKIENALLAHFQQPSKASSLNIDRAGLLIRGHGVRLQLKSGETIDVKVVVKKNS